MDVWATGCCIYEMYTGECFQFYRLCFLVFLFFCYYLCFFLFFCATRINVVHAREVASLYFFFRFPTTTPFTLDTRLLLNGCNSNSHGLLNLSGFEFYLLFYLFSLPTNHLCIFFWMFVTRVLLLYTSLPPSLIMHFPLTLNRQNMLPRSDK